MPDYSTNVSERIRVAAKRAADGAPLETLAKILKIRVDRAKSIAAICEVATEQRNQARYSRLFAVMPAKLRRAFLAGERRSE